MFEIREIKSSEYDFLWEMLYEAIFLPADEDRPPKAIVNEPHNARYVRKFGRRGDFGLVLLNNGELVGAIWTRVFGLDEQGYGFFDELTPELSMAIREPYRGRGFGTLLIERAIEKLKTEKVKAISLSVDKRNPAARLYQRCGFEIIAEPGSAYTMLKTL